MRKLTLPKTLKFASLVYKIKTQPQIAAGGNEYFGECDNDNQVIRIATSFPSDRQVQTLVHESLHAIENLYGLSFEEEEVEMLALGLTTFLLDNDLLKGIFEEEPASKRKAAKPGKIGFREGEPA